MSRKITTIGGGSGQYILLSGLRDIKDFKITAIVSMLDSGGSTGRLRDELGVLPPGDVLKCILALSPYRESAREILQKRFKTNNKLAEHSVGNMLLTMLSQYCNDFTEGVKALGEVLEIRGQVLPVTTDKASLVAELTDGSWLFGEAAIDIPRGDQREKIKRTFLVPHHSDSIKVYPKCLQAIAEADYIVLGPGDLFTSIIPNLLVTGIKEELRKTKAKLIYVANIMTKFGETEDFQALDFVTRLEGFLPRKIDLTIFNQTKPPLALLQKYQKQKAVFVEPPEKNLKFKKNIIADLVSVSGGIIRHDDQKLANLIKELI